MANNDKEYIFLSDNFNMCHDVQLEKGVDGLFDSFARLDSRISSVGQTAAKIGDHLQVKLCLKFNYHAHFYFIFFPLLI